MASKTAQLQSPNQGSAFTELFGVYYIYLFVYDEKSRAACGTAITRIRKETA
jgi:hypothetical protein